MSANDEVVWTRPAVKTVYVVQYKNKYGTWSEFSQFYTISEAVEYADTTPKTVDVRIVERTP